MNDSTNIVALEQVRPGEKELTVGERLSLLAEEHLTWRRGRFEARWMQDIAQYSALTSVSPRETENQEQKEGTGAVVGLNMTARFCNLGMSRIGDLLFPGDGARNWGMDSEPESYLSDTATDDTPVTDLIGEDIEDDRSVGDVAYEMIEDERARANAMERTIASQFARCRYPKAARLAIRDACIYGTGVLKGPIIPIAPSREWVPVPGGQPWERMLRIGPNTTAAVEWVDLWDFFPDMSALTLEDCRFVFERRFLTRERLLAIKHLPGARKGAIDMVARTPTRNYYKVDDLREWYRGGTLSANESRAESRYPLFCYTGPEQPRDLIALFDEGDKKPPFGDEIGLKYQIWFVGQTVVRADILPMDTGDFGYSVFPWEPDPVNFFGFGVPYRTRHTQKVADGAFREMVNNVGVTAMPQFLVNRQVVEAADGQDERIRSGKVWYLNQLGFSAQDVFAMIDIPSNAGEFMEIINMCEQFMSMESMQPPIAAGEGPAQSQTAQGTAIISNNAGANTRRLVRQWDDHITMTMLPRFVDWNMQFSRNPAIKGKSQFVVPKGVSVLLQRELQAHNLMTFAMSFMNDPVFGKHIKERENLEQILRAHHIEPADMLKAPEVVAREEQERMEAEAAQPPEPNAEILKIQLDSVDRQQKMEQSQAQFMARMEHEQNELMLKFQQMQDESERFYAKLAADSNTDAIKEQGKALSDDKKGKVDLTREMLKQRGQAERDQAEIAAEQPNPRIQ